MGLEGLATPELSGLFATRSIEACCFVGIWRDLQFMAQPKHGFRYVSPSSAPLTLLRMDGWAKLNSELETAPPEIRRKMLGERLYAKVRKVPRLP